MQGSSTDLRFHSGSRPAAGTASVASTSFLLLASAASLLSFALSIEAQAESVDVPVSSLHIQAHVQKSGDFMGFGFDSLWMMSGSSLVRVNPNNDQVAAEVSLGDGGHGPFRGVGIGFGGVWVPDTSTHTIYKIEPATNQVTKKISAPFSGSEGTIGVGENALWVVTSETGSSKTLSRINPESGAVEAKIPLPGSGAGVVTIGGSVWVTGDEKGELYRIDPATNSLTKTTKLHDGSRFVAAGLGAVWVLNQSDGTVQKIDSSSGEVIATIETGLRGGGGDITVGGGSVWVTMPGFPVSQIDPFENKLVHRYQGGGFGDAIRYGGGSLWVSGGTISRIEPPPSVHGTEPAASAASRSIR